LLDRVVDPWNRAEGCSRLHLKLAVVNPGLIIEEGPGEMGCKAPPIEVERIRSERNKHCPGSEIQPIRCIERSHAGIDEGVSCHAKGPSLIPFLVPATERFGRGIDAPEFHPGEGFEFLKKMIPPAQPPVEAVTMHDASTDQRSTPAHGRVGGMSGGKTSPAEMG